MLDAGNSPSPFRLLAKPERREHVVTAIIILRDAPAETASRHQTSPANAGQTRGDVVSNRVQLGIVGPHLLKPVLPDSSKNKFAQLLADAAERVLAGRQRAEDAIDAAHAAAVAAGDVAERAERGWIIKVQAQFRRRREFSFDWRKDKQSTRRDAHRRVKQRVL